MSALLNEKVKVPMDRILHNMDTCASCPRKAKKWRWLPSGHTLPGQRRINVGATSWRCTDVDATLHLRHHVAPTLTRRCIKIMCLQGMNRILHNKNTCAWDPKKSETVKVSSSMYEIRIGAESPRMFSVHWHTFVYYWYSWLCKRAALY